MSFFIRYCFLSLMVGNFLAARWAITDICPKVLNSSNGPDSWNGFSCR